MTEVIAQSYASAEEAGGQAYSYWNATTQSIQRLYADKYYNPQTGRYEGPQSNAEYSESVRAQQQIQQARAEQEALQQEAQAQQEINQSIDRAFEQSERAFNSALSAGVSARQQVAALGVGAMAALTAGIGGAIAEQDRRLQQDLHDPAGIAPVREKNVRPSIPGDNADATPGSNETSVKVPETTPDVPPTLPPVTPPALLDPVSDLAYSIGLENRFSFVAPSVEAKKRKKAKRTPKASRNTNTGPRSMQVNIPAAMGVAVTRGGRESMPRFAGSNGRCLVQNFELVRAFKAQNATGNAPFNGAGGLQDSLSCNPGIATAFPWCSAIALSYSKFRFKFLRYMFIPSVPTSIPGQAYIYTAYDASDTAPASIAQVMTADGSSTGPVWMGGGINTEKAFRSNMNIADAVFVDIDLKQLTQPYYYVRTQAGITEDSRPLIMFWGSDNATFAGPTTLNLSPGSLYVAYIIEFFDPVLSSLNV